jgi:hypothetical protein
MEKRLYLIRPKADPGSLGRLIEARHPSQALRHVARDAYEVSIPSAIKTAGLVKAGVPIENPDAPPELPEQPF